MLVVCLYDPEVGRFLNADGYVSTGQGLLGNNMYAYCSNNPVMYVDPTGEFAELAAIGIGGKIAGALATVASAIMSAPAVAVVCVVLVVAIATVAVVSIVRAQDDEDDKATDFADSNNDDD